jgi:hypothetical protein
MSWSSRSRLTSLLCSSLLLLTAASLRADDQALWNEFGLTNAVHGATGKVTYTAYRMRDLTGALAAWEWQRAATSTSCELAAFCSQDGQHVTLLHGNYLVAFDRVPPAASLPTLFKSLPDARDTELPAILTFLPRSGLVPNSARYILGPASLQAFASELGSVKPGFAEGAEAQVAEYRLSPSDAPVRLAIFYYPTPEMARLRAAEFKRSGDLHIKRSGVLVAVVYGDASSTAADTLLSRVQYEAKITWNDVPPPSPIKPMYQLLMNIIYLSCILSGLCLLAGLMYAGMRLYRRRYGQLEADEAMTTLHLTGD